MRWQQHHSVCLLTCLSFLATVAHYGLEPCQLYCVSNSHYSLIYRLPSRVPDGTPCITSHHSVDGVCIVHECIQVSIIIVTYNVPGISTLLMVHVYLKYAPQTQFEEILNSLSFSLQIFTCKSCTLNHGL